MGLLDRFRRQAKVLDRPLGGYTPITHYDVMDEVQLIAGREYRLWKDKLHLIGESGEPMAAFGGFAGLEGANLSSGPSQPLPTALGAVTLASGDINPYNGQTYCPVPSRAPVHCSYYMAFTLALAASPGTLLFTAGVGTAGSSKNLGAMAATATLGTAGTAGGFVRGDLSIRGTGSGTAAAAYFTGHCLGKLATSGNGTADVNQIFGYTALTYDSTVQNGFWMTLTGTGTSVTISVQQIMFGSWN